MEREIVFSSEDLQQVIMEFPAGIQDRYIHLTQRILAFGPNLGMHHSRAVSQGLFELPLMSKEGIGRVFYCNLTHQRVMMLHAFVKKSAKTPAKELKIARDRMKEVRADADTKADGEADAQGTHSQGNVRRPDGGICPVR
jgi:phage-related protein